MKKKIVCSSLYGEFGSGFVKTSVARLKIGAFFTLSGIKEPKENKVYVRGEYDVHSKTYSCHKFSDVNSERFLLGDSVVYAGFIF